MHIYNTSHLAKVIEFTYITYITYITPPSQLLLTGMRKKSEKSCRKIWRGMGSELYICSAEGAIIGCASDYALMQIAPAVDGGSSDSSSNV